MQGRQHNRSLWRIPAGLLSGAFALWLLVPSFAAASADRDVVVTNAANQPVPVVQQGTLAVQGSINVGNTPNVIVSNTATNPVAVNVVAEAPQQQFLTASAGRFGAEMCSNVSVPVGRTLRIDAVSLEAEIRDGSGNKPMAYLSVSHYEPDSLDNVRILGSDWFPTDRPGLLSAVFHGPLLAIQAQPGTFGDSVAVCAAGETGVRAYVTGTLLSQPGR